MRVVAGPTDDLISVETTDGLGRRSLFGAVNNRLAPLLDDALVAGLPSGSAGTVLDDSFSGCCGVERFWFCSFCQDFNKFWILFFVTEVWPFWKVRELWSFDGNSSRRRRWDLRTKIWPVWERVLRNVGSFFHSFAQRFLRSDFLSPPFAPRALDGGIFLSTALYFSHRSQPRTVCSFQLANSAGSGKNGASTNKALNQLKRRRNPFDGTWAKHMFGL